MRTMKPRKMAPHMGLNPRRRMWPRRVSEPCHVRVFLQLLYGDSQPLDTPISHLMPPKEARNHEIYRRYIEGARAVDLAAEYGVSLQRVYVIIRIGKRSQC